MLGGYGGTSVKDIELDSPPSDGISCLSWSSKANHLVAASWDKSLRCWEISGAPNNTQSKALAMSSVPAPILSATWADDGARVFAGACDNNVHCWNLQNSHTTVIGSHAAPVKAVCYVPSLQCVVSGSWDKTIKYWDTRSPNPVATVNMPERVYSLDVADRLLVCATAERRIVRIDLANPANIQDTKESPLKYQTRCVSAFPNASGYCIGSIEGRVHVECFNPHPVASFSFKCHREGDNIYAINGISFSRQWGTFATCGSDGMVTFWDKDNKQSLKKFTKQSNSISAISFNQHGDLFASAISYDFHRGQHTDLNRQHKITVHPSLEGETKPRPKKK